MTTAALPAAGEVTTRSLPRWLWVLPPLVVLFGIFYYPLALIVRQSVTLTDGAVGMAPYWTVLGSHLFRAALLHTIEISTTSTLGCLVLGFVLALIVSFVPFPGSRAVSGFIDAFLAFPSFLIALSFTFLYGAAGMFNYMLMDVLHTSQPPMNFVYTQYGVIFAEITFYTPFVMRPLMASFAQIDSAFIEIASSLGARPMRIIREVIFPEAVPALLAGGSLCLLLTLNEFGIVLFIGAKGVITLPMLLYGKAIQEFDYTGGCVVAIMNIGLSLLLYALYRFLLSRTGGKGAGLV